jgi:hypothetical protein
MPRGNIELMPPQETLDFKPASQLERLGDEHCEHRSIPGIMLDDALMLSHRANLRRWNSRA